MTPRLPPLPPHLAQPAARAAARLAALTPAPPAWAAFAPGRVNLIGEHTDYNLGLVLPFAIDRACVALAAPLPEGPGPHWALASDDLGRADLVDPTSPIEPDPASRGHWSAYVRGVLRHFQDLHAPLPRGIAVAFASSVPLGAGLSSSASLEAAAATLLESITGITLDPRAKANACRSAEHDFAGVPCGIMDQTVSVMARAGHALLLDCRDESTRHVPMPPTDLASILVINTRVKHALADGAYAERRQACRRAAQRLGLQDLRAAESAADHAGETGGPLAFLERRRTALDPDAYRAAHHVIAENLRVADAARALAAGDLPSLGRLMNQSHDSLRDDFRVSCTELDTAVDAARDCPGVLGARMTGGGFGGCAIALLQPNATTHAPAAIKARFLDAFGSPCETFTVLASDGARTFDPATVTPHPG